MNTKYFFNWSGEDFIQSYNSEEWKFEAGQYMLLKEGLADFFAMKLTDRELQKAGLQVDDARRAEFIGNCFKTPEDAPSVDTAAASSEKTEALIMNAEIQRKRGRPKKEIKLDENTFEGA